MATNTIPTKQTLTAVNNSSGNTSGPYSISFDYLSESDVEVRVDNTLKTQTTQYTFPTRSTIQFTSGHFPPLGSSIEIKRNTDITIPKVDFEDGSVLTESDLDNNSKHILFGMQETKDDVEGLISTFVGDTAPTGTNIVNGSRWYDNVSGRSFVYYVDEDTAQWVEANPPFDAEGGTRFLQSGTGAVSTTVNAKLQEVVSVKDFGAVGDNSNDDTAAFQNAINTGKPVFVPKGKYKITNTLTLNSTGKGLIGDASMPEIFMHTELKPAIEIVEPVGLGFGATNEYCRLENLYIQRTVNGSYTVPHYNSVLTESLAGVVVSGDNRPLGATRSAPVQYVRISNLRVRNFAVGFYFADCVSVTVHKCFVQTGTDHEDVTSYVDTSGTTVTIDGNMWGVGFYFDATRYGSTASTDVSENTIEFGNAHGLSVGNPVFIDGLTNTTGISNNVMYFVKEVPNTTSIKLAASTAEDSSVIDLTGQDQTGIYVAKKEISPLASIEIVECDDLREGDPSPIKSVSYLCHGRDLRDIFFQRSESTKAKYGWYIDGLDNNDLNWDLHIIRPIVDQYKTNGIFVTNLDGVGSLSVTGGYFVGKSGSGASVYASNSNGISVTGGGQFLGLTNNTTSDKGVEFSSCSSCSVVGNRFGNCRFGVHLTNTTFSTIVGNIFSAAATEDEPTPTLTDAISLNGTSSDNTIADNTIRGKDATHKYGTGINIVKTCINNKVIGNTIDSASVTDSIVDRSGTIITGQPSFKNRIINGGINVWQRATTISNTTNAYTADRWKVSSDNSNISVNLVPTPFAYAKNAVRIKATTNNPSFIQFGQQIENINCWDLQGKKVTISFWAKALNGNSASTSLKVRTRTKSSETDLIFHGTAAVVETTLDLTTDWTKQVVTRTLPTSFVGLSLEFVLGDVAADDGIELALIQLEEGDASQFERRTYQQELQLCKRYFQLQGAGLAGLADDTSRWSVVGRFDPVMKSQPSIVVTSATPQVRSRASDVTASGAAVAYSSLSENGFHAGISGFSGLTQGDAIIERGANNFLSFEAEF